MSEQEFDCRSQAIVQQQVAELAAQVQAIFDDLDTKLAEIYRAWEEKYGVPYPRSVEEWSKLAVFAGIPADMVLKGDWTLRDMAPIIEGHLLRLRGWAPPNGETKRASDERCGDVILAAKVVVGGKRTPELLRIVTIANGPGTLEHKLTAIARTGLLRDDASASQLAALLRCSPAGVKKTRWWRGYMARRTQCG